MCGLRRQFPLLSHVTGRRANSLELANSFGLIIFMPSIDSVILVALGGAHGSVFRYLLSTWTQTVSRSIDFPDGTLVVNLVECFVIGLLAQVAETRGVFTSGARVFLFIGILGGFTTFS
jgi:fluoride ion exporter CrcB/FEX